MITLRIGVRAAPREFSSDPWLSATWSRQDGPAVEIGGAYDGKRAALRLDAEAIRRVGHWLECVVADVVSCEHESRIPGTLKCPECTTRRAEIDKRWAAYRGTAEPPRSEDRR